MRKHWWLPFVRCISFLYGGPSEICVLPSIVLSLFSFDGSVDLSVVVISMIDSFIRISFFADKLDIVGGLTLMEKHEGI